MSTPRGQHCYFYNAWVSRHTWLRIAVPATECPRISKEFLDSERAQSTDRYFRQEYMCDFLGSQSSFLPHNLLARFAAGTPVCPNTVKAAQSNPVKQQLRITTSLAARLDLNPQ